MSEDNQKRVDNRTATQRLEALEQVCGALYNTIQELIRANDRIAPLVADVPTLKEAAKLLNKRVEALVSVADASSGISAETVSAKMVEMNVSELKDQIGAWVTNGALVANETGADSESFVVAEETTVDGTVANPRVQFPMRSQSTEIQANILGKKVGDKVDLGAEKLGLTILELYTITPPPSEAPPQASEGQEATADQSAATESAQDTAPATEASA